MARRVNPFSGIIFFMKTIGWTLGALSKLLNQSSGTSINFARQGSGGRFRRVTQDEVDQAIAPVSDMVRQAHALAAKSGTMTQDQAEKILAEIMSLADRIDNACDAYERQNFSFSHRRNAGRYEQFIASARGVARDLRKADFEPQSGERNV